MDWTNPLTYAVILTVVTVVGSACWRIFSWVAKIDPLPEALADSTDQFEKTLADSTDRFEKTVAEFAREIREDIKKILHRLVTTVEGGGPLRLSELGHRISSELKVRDWAANIAPTLLPNVKGLEDFQIDEFSRHYVREQLGPEWTDRIAACAYEHGIGQEAVRAVLQVVLRSELIRLNSGNVSVAAQLG